jgi:tRNA-2-methylthio-N6-dimethylallyladenosine synthase
MNTEEFLNTLITPSTVKRGLELNYRALKLMTILFLTVKTVSQAWISVMRGCDKFCTFCVVPFTRGRERSKPLESVVKEIKLLSERGFREVTLLGQNVNSYLDNQNDFADLLSTCAVVDRKLRIRFTTSHPQDLSDKLLYTIAEHSNLCSYIHLPVQSGSIEF